MRNYFRTSVIVRLMRTRCVQAAESDMRGDCQVESAGPACREVSTRPFPRAGATGNAVARAVSVAWQFLLQRAQEGGLHPGSLGGEAAAQQPSHCLQVKEGFLRRHS